MVSLQAFELPHDKINKMTVCPVKTHISLDIRPVWSESWLCAQWVAKDPSFLHADSEDSDQTGRMPRLIWVFAGRTCHFVGFVMRRLIFVASKLHVYWFGVNCFTEIDLSSNLEWRIASVHADMTWLYEVISKFVWDRLDEMFLIWQVVNCLGSLAQLVFPFACNKPCTCTGYSKKCMHSDLSFEKNVLM